MKSIPKVNVRAYGGMFNTIGITSLFRIKIFHDPTHKSM